MPQQWYVGDMVLVEVAGIDRVVHDPFALRDVRGKDRPRQAAPQCQDGITLVEIIDRHVGATVRPGAQGQRVCFIEAAFAKERGHDRRGQELGQRRHGGGGLPVEHALSTPDHRPGRVEQQPGGVTDRIGVSTRASCLDGLVVEFTTEFLDRDIHGNLDALRGVLDDLDARGVERILCLGDTVGYGPNPCECLDLVIERCEWSLMGNHDFAVLYEPTAFNTSAEASAFWTRRQLELEPNSQLRHQRWQYLGNLRVRDLGDVHIFIT